jgi:hypothetical protein
MKRQILTLFCVVGLSANAFAASVTVNGWTLGEDVNIAAGGHTGWVDTAELNLTAAGMTGYSYCVDLAQTIGPGTTTGWTITSSLSDSVTRAAWLVDTFRPEFTTMVHPAGGDWSFGVNRQTEIAALQVAVWEVMSDTPGNYDLFSGSFALAAGGASDGVANLARSMLGSLNGADLSGFKPDALFLGSRVSQDQLFFGPSNPIPEAGTLTLYLVGAAVGAFGLRRRSA